MNKFKGVKCQVCHKEFQDDEQIVVCPTCGTPYHKKCYDEVGKCLFEEQHGKYYFENKQEENSKAVDEKLNSSNEKDDEEQIKCPYCGALNNKKETVCERCQMFLTMEPEVFIFNPDKEKILKEEKVLGINIKDWFAYFGSSGLSYLVKFKATEKKKLSWLEFNISAFLFGKLYFLYRKMYLAGGLFFLVESLITSIVTYMFMPVNLQNSVLDVISNIYKSFANGGLINLESYNTIFNQIDVFASNNQQLINYILFSKFVLSLIMGVTATRIYKNISLKKIKSVNRSIYANDAAYRDSLAKKGSVNSVIVFIFIFILLLFRGF